MTPNEVLTITSAEQMAGNILLRLANILSQGDQSGGWTIFTRSKDRRQPLVVICRGENVPPSNVEVFVRPIPSGASEEDIAQVVKIAGGEEERKYWTPREAVISLGGSQAEGLVTIPGADFLITKPNGHLQVEVRRSGREDRENVRLFGEAHDILTTQVLTTRVLQPQPNFGK